MPGFIVSIVRTFFIQKWLNSPTSLPRGLSAAGLVVWDTNIAYGLEVSEMPRQVKEPDR